MPQETASFIVLLIGSLDPEQSQLLAQSGLAMQSCANAYDAAERVRDLGDALRGVCISPGALTSPVVSLIALIKEKFPRVTLYLPPNSTGKRAELAAKLGLSRWEAPAPVPQPIAAKIPDVPVIEDDESPPAPKEKLSEPARIVRMAPRPRNLMPPKSAPAADNGNLASPAGLPMDADIAARYDAETGEQILTDDELRALLDDSADSIEPTDPRRT